MKHSLSIAFLLLLLAACNPKPDLLIINADIYTGSPAQEQADALVIKDGEIIFLGDSDNAKKKYGDAKTLDAQGQFVMPGLIEGHGHFMGLGSSLLNLDLLHTTSWQEVLDEVEKRVKETDEGSWIYGRGWHQEKWTDAPDQSVQGFPTHDQLSAISPNNPVILEHASGHGLLANAKAMELAGITDSTASPSGGVIVRDNNGNAIGVFQENASSLIERFYNESLAERTEDEIESHNQRVIQLAEQHCLENGITSFQDAGASFNEISRYKSLAEAGELDVRLWSMMSGGNNQRLTEENTAEFPIVDAGNGYFTCRAIKAYMDGALGSRGAWLLEDYEDKAGYRGENVTSVEDIQRNADIAKLRGLQLCVHAIGDRGNKEVIDIMEAADSEDLRWRIEHAQHLHPSDVGRMAENNIIASMQSIHCTSDSPFVEKRLGPKRAEEGAYIWQTLQEAGVRMANGTDVPVEKLNPMANLYASVTRKRTDDGSVFYEDQKLNRKQALKLYTLDNAYAAFEEEQKGSLEVGKYADLIILDKNLLTCAEEEILSTNVLYTIVGGEVKYKAE